MASDAEIELRILQTQEFIAAESSSVVFVRRPWVSDGAGGFKRGTAVNVAAQQLRLIGSNTQLPVRQTVDGREIQPNYTIVGMPDLDITSGDTFVLGGIRYEVVFVYSNKLEATRAEVGYGR